MTRKDRSIARRQSESLVGYDEVLADLVGLLESARRAAARSVNALMTSTYWLVGRRIVEEEQRERPGRGTERRSSRGSPRTSSDASGGASRCGTWSRCAVLSGLADSADGVCGIGAAPAGVITQTASADSESL